MVEVGTLVQWAMARVTSSRHSAAPRCSSGRCPFPSSRNWIGRSFGAQRAAGPEAKEIVPLAPKNL